MLVLPLIILGFAMLTLGFAMLWFGEVPFVGGKRIPARRSRVIGGILVSFPVVLWVVRSLIGLIVGTNTAGGPMVAWALLFVYLLLIFALLFRILVPKAQEPRPETVGDDLVQRSEEDSNPFHFS